VVLNGGRAMGTARLKDPIEPRWSRPHVGMDTEPISKGVRRLHCLCDLERGPSLCVLSTEFHLYESENVANKLLQFRTLRNHCCFRRACYTTETAIGAFFINCPKGFKSRPSDFAKVSNSDDLFSSTATNNPPLVCGSARTAFCSSVMELTFFP
jgi:hypothetical protein